MRPTETTNDPVKFCSGTIKALNAKEGGFPKKLAAYSSLKAKNYSVLGALGGDFEF